MKGFRHFFGIIISIFCWINALTQDKFSDTALYKIRYKFIYVYDTTDIKKKYTEDMGLYVGGTYSVFRNIDYELFEQQKKKELQQIMEQVQTGDLSKPIQPNADIRKIPRAEFFKKINGNDAYKKESIGSKDYLIESTLPQIQWTMGAETKMLGDIKCQKAQAYFRGRNYTAWFAPSLPLRAGPWKLSGLPGIILEASDEKQEVVFLFAGLERLQKEMLIVIALPYRYIKTTAGDYDRLYNLYLEDPAAFIRNRLAQSGMTITVNGNSLDNIKQPVKKPTKSPINNPLELVKD